MHIKIEIPDAIIFGITMSLTSYIVFVCNDENPLECVKIVSV